MHRNNLRQVVKNRISILLPLIVIGLLILFLPLFFEAKINNDNAKNVYANPIEENKRKFDVSNEHFKGTVGFIGTLATIGAGIVLYLNFRVASKQAEIASKNTEIASKNTEIANKNAEITESRLITERFSKAVEQLGSDKIEVRLGGIYALERIAQDSERDHWTIMEVLTSFVREKSPLISDEQIRAKAYELWGARDKTISPEQNWHDACQALAAKSVSEDVQAALTVIGRRDVTKDPSNKKINLSQANLSKANLSQANLSKANLSQANLSEANLRQANLSQANLSQANLSEANLRQANLSNVYLFNADLSYALLSFANLSNAYSIAAKFSNANLFKADLSNSRLFNADLSYAHLRRADLSNTDLSNSDLSNTNLVEAKLSEAKLFSTKFSNADLTDACFSSAKLFKADFSQANLSFADLTEKQLEKAYLCHTILMDSKTVNDRDCETLDNLKVSILLHWPLKFPDSGDFEFNSPPNWGG